VENGLFCNGFPDRRPLKCLLNFSGIGETEPEAGLLTPEERARMLQLCQRIAGEKDLQIFDQLAKELHQLLNNRRDRVEQGAGLTDRA
jgi:hypothetical protein